ncbi:hypothetical protein CR513_30369, partial [Mucuna pruriens]
MKDKIVESDFFPIRVEHSGLKGVLLVRIMESNTNRMNLRLMKNETLSINSLKFKEGTSLSDHLNEFQGIIDQMSGMSIKFEDEILGLLFLNSLPESWETFKVSVTNSAPNGVVSLQMVKDSVLNKEIRRKAQGSSSQSEVLVIENRGRSQKNEREKSRSKSKSRYKNVACHYCPKTEHIHKHYFLWKKENKDKKGKSKEKDDDRVTTATGDDLVILQDFELSIWIIDSSAMLHVTPRKEFFTSYTSGDFRVLKMGNDGVTKVIDVGNVCLQTNTEMQLWLRGVKHASDVRRTGDYLHIVVRGEICWVTLGHPTMWTKTQYSQSSPLCLSL